jgi:2-oxoisovalerate dehydrogenase E1 component
VAVGGTVNVNVILRLPVEPLHGGSVYHSMCMEGFYAAIPGLTIVAPTTSRDVYGLLRSAAEYTGPVICLRVEGAVPHDARRRVPGRADRPQGDRGAQAGDRVRRAHPGPPDDFRVPLGKAALRRAGRT